MRPVLTMEERSKILSPGSRNGISPLSEISDISAISASMCWSV